MEKVTLFFVSEKTDMTSIINQMKSLSSLLKDYKFDFHTIEFSLLSIKQYLPQKWGLKATIMDHAAHRIKWEINSNFEGKTMFPEAYVLEDDITNLY